MIGKRGQLDKAIGALPILFLILVAAAVFLLLVSGILTGKKMHEATMTNVPIRMPVLFDSVSAALPEGLERLTVMEYFNWTNSHSEFARDEWILFENSVSSLTPRGGCLALTWVRQPGDPSSIYGFFADNSRGNIDKISSMESYSKFMDLYSEYNSQGLLFEKEISFLSGATYRFGTYKGECLNE